MKVFVGLVVVALICAANGIRLDGFRAKHAWSSALKDTESFFDIPRNVKDAEAAGFLPVARATENGMEVSMRCLQNDVRVCPLYDKAGYIAGMQIAIPMKDLDGIPYDISTKMVLKTIQGDDYWTTSHYIVSQETLNSGGRHGPLDETVQFLWVQNGHQLMQIPTSESELSSTLFKKQNCIPNMGTHYYYNMTEELDCNKLFSYFPLVKEGRVIGLGWQIIGKTTERDRPWFESPPARAVEMTIPSAPPCLQDWAKTYEVTSLHMYYIDTPWKIKCEDSDSLQPMSVVDKFLLTSTRYTGKVIDGAKKIFG